MNHEAEIDDDVRERLGFTNPSLGNIAIRSSSTTFEFQRALELVIADSLLRLSLSLSIHDMSAYVVFIS
jgi:hypothetical protein